MRFQPLIFLSSLSLIVLANGVALTSANANSVVSASVKQDVPTEEVPEDDAPVGDAPVVIEGSLEPGDNVLSSDGSLYDEHPLDGVTGQTITITLESPDFDTYLFLIGPDGNVVSENDDISADNLNSELAVTLEADGGYTIVANGFDSQSQGSYTLTITTTP